MTIISFQPAFRLGLLWKFGGTYLDLDIVSLNPLTLTNSENGTPYSMGKFIAREEGEQLNNAALRFPPNDIFLEAIINDFVNNFDGYTW